VNPLWQILCPTLVSRRHFLARLNERLSPQLTPDVELVTLEDDGERSIGEKRQAMLEGSTAPWVCFFDDDDLPAADYVSSVLEVINGTEPVDVVGFKLDYIQDGRHRAIAVHSYDAVNIPIGPVSRRISKFNRLPNHLNPVRLELALQVGYLPRNTGEDSAYAQGLSRLRPRPVERFIDKVVYTYDYRSRRPGERTNAVLTGVR
jgi:hypothetical protein